MHLENGTTIEFAGKKGVKTTGVIQGMGWNMFGHITGYVVEVEGQKRRTTVFPSMFPEMKDHFLEDFDYIIEDEDGMEETEEAMEEPEEVKEELPKPSFTINLWTDNLNRVMDLNGLAG